MYHATFICDDRNGDDGILDDFGFPSTTRRFATLRDAMRAVQHDAESHAAMYADSEPHWHAAFTDASRRLSIVSVGADALSDAFGFPLELEISGKDDGQGYPWRLGHYSITRIVHACRTCGATDDLHVDGDDIRCHPCMLDDDLARHFADQRRRAASA